MPSAKLKNTQAKAPRREKFSVPRGMKDILPEERPFWDYLYNKVKSFATAYGFGHIETPTVEESGLFERGVGEHTDIVEKEMFYLKSSSSGQRLVLRPENTAAVCRAYIEHGMHTLTQPVKLFAFGQRFRHDRPQAGRYRQFWQWDFDALGGQDAVLDAQIIMMNWQIFKELKLKGITVQINSVGCSACRPEHIAALKEYYRTQESKLCTNCKKRLETNPLRLLDCKEEKCQRLAGNAPQIIDHLCEECHNHFKAVLEYLDELEVPYNLNPNLVRGLDYYTKTAFEFWPEDDGLRGSLGGGGRYDDLVKILGGRPTPAVGAAIGVERVIALMKEQGVTPPKTSDPDIFLAQLGEVARKKGLKFFEKLRQEGITVIESFGRTSITSQFRLADKFKVPFALVIGQKEAVEDTVIIRDMSSGIQETVPSDRIINEVKNRLAKIKEMRRREAKKEIPSSPEDTRSNKPNFLEGI